MATEEKPPRGKVCPNCGLPVDSTTAKWCPNCGAILNPSPDAGWRSGPQRVSDVPDPQLVGSRYAEAEGLLMTGNVWGDRVLGFFICLFMQLFVAVGWIGGLVLWILQRRKYPEFCMGVGAGLILGVLAILGLLALCFGFG